MNLTNNHKLPQFILDMIQEDEREIVPNSYSTTEILKGTKEIILSRRHREHIITDVSEHIDKLLGTVLHDLFERNDGNERTEIKLEYPITKLTTLTGRFDRQDGFTLEDYKLTRVNKVIREDFEDYKLQGLIYAWLLLKNGQYVEKLRFYLFLKDFSKMRVDIDQNYPKSQIYVWEYVIKSSDLQFIEKYIREKILEIEKQSLLSDDDITPCLPDERWNNGDKYAVLKFGGKRAVKIFDTPDEAIAYCNSLGSGYTVEKRQGEDVKCNNYCEYKEFCNHWRDKKWQD